MADPYRALQRVLLFGYLGYQLVFGIVAGWDALWRSAATTWLLSILIAGCGVLEALRHRRRSRGTTSPTERAAGGGAVPGRWRLAVRSAAAAVWVTLRTSVVDDEGAHEPSAPPDRGAGTERGRLRLESLFSRRAEARVLADRLGTSPVELWGNGVPVVVARQADEILIEFGGSVVLTARQIDPGARTCRLQLVGEPTNVPLLLAMAPGSRRTSESRTSHGRHASQHAPAQPAHHELAVRNGCPDGHSVDHLAIDDRRPRVGE